MKGSASIYQQEMLSPLLSFDLIHHCHRITTNKHASSKSEKIPTFRRPLCVFRGSFFVCQRLVTPLKPFPLVTPIASIISSWANTESTGTWMWTTFKLILFSLVRIRKIKWSEKQSYLFLEMFISPINFFGDCATIYLYFHNMSLFLPMFHNFHLQIWIANKYSIENKWDTNKQSQVKKKSLSPYPKQTCVCAMTRITEQYFFILAKSACIDFMPSSSCHFFACFWNAFFLDEFLWNMRTLTV